jgi:2-succinyl-6-hydroxy-2,4-cyclohexadiene-1-carboxylate synthase
MGGAKSVSEGERQQGDAPPVVLIHGFAGGPSMWDDVLPDGWRGPGLRCLGLPGHGAVPPASATHFKDVVAEIADQVPIRCHLVGYSMGARIALAWALSRPDRVASATLMGVQPGLEDPTERGRRASWDEEQAALIETVGVEGFIDEWEKLPLFASQTSNATARALRRQRETRLAHDAHGLAWAMRHLGVGAMPPQWSALRRCQTPIELLIGENDTKFRAVATRIVATAPRVRQRVVAGAGHNVALEAPAEVRVVIQALRGR